MENCRPCCKEAISNSKKFLKAFSAINILLTQCSMQVCLPGGKSLYFRSLFLIDGLVALDEGKVGLGCNMGGASVSRNKQDLIRVIICYINEVKVKF